MEFGFADKYNLCPFGKMEMLVKQFSRYGPAVIRKEEKGVAFGAHVYQHTLSIHRIDLEFTPVVMAIAIDRVLRKDASRKKEERKSEDVSHGKS